jgi:hypothetical protein
VQALSGPGLASKALTSNPSHPHRPESTPPLPLRTSSLTSADHTSSVERTSERQNILFVFSQRISSLQPLASW